MAEFRAVRAEDFGQPPILLQ